MPLDDGAFQLLRGCQRRRGPRRDRATRSAGPSMTTPIFTIANQLTLLRLLLIPAFVCC